MSISRQLWRSFGLVLVAGLVSACCLPLRERQPVVPGEGLEPASAELLASLVDDGDLSSLVAAVRESLAYFRGVGAQTGLKLGDKRYSPQAMARSFDNLLLLMREVSDPDELASKLSRSFSFYRVRRPQGVLFTGYYHPVISASLSRNEIYRYPIRGRPADLVSFYLPDICPACPPRVASGRLVGGRLLPYLSRAEIEAGAPGTRGQPIAWARDPVDVFFLQVQGSGSLLLPDGSHVRVAFAASNGRPYRSIARKLIDDGKLDLESASAGELRHYLAAHPQERDEILLSNPRYVFFEVTDNPPTGSLGVELTPGRSIATDPRLYPPGTLAFVRTERYAPALNRFVPLSRFVLNQDTGAAITGPGRVDIYWGEGKRAEAMAGRQRTRGELFLVMPKQAG